MAEIRVLIFLVLNIVCVECAVLSVKALYCRDPVTGKLHAVNTTWASSAFCGNYTCKIRKRNNTQNNDVPIRELNVTNKETTNNQETHMTEAVTIENKLVPDIIQIIHKNGIAKNIMPDDLTKFHSKFNNVKYYLNPVEEKHKLTRLNSRRDGDISKSYEEHDRYLTEEEINNIAEILHTVKRSDLDALVDIYDLAQDMYTEIHKISDDELTEAAINIIQEEERHKKHNHKYISYWYGPLQNKEKVAETDLDLQETMGKAADHYDLELQDTHTMQSTGKPEDKLQPIKNKSFSPTYFDGPLMKKDFGKLPYNFPMSHFHRLSTYTHRPSQVSQPPILSRQDSTVVKNPCTTKININKHQTTEKLTEKLIQPSFLLPYPFANIHQYNISKMPNHFYYGGRPWKYYNTYKYYGPYTQTPIPKVINMNPYLPKIQEIEQEQVKTKNSKDFFEKWLAKSTNLPDWKTGSLLQDQKTEPLSVETLKDERANIDTSKLINAFPFRNKVFLEKVETKSMSLPAWKTGSLLQDWKTDPLSVETLKDIRANIDNSKIIKAFPFRKKVFLEKVGKVKRTDKVMNSELNRSKRSQNNETRENDGDISNYETYLENITKRKMGTTVLGSTYRRVSHIPRIMNEVDGL